MGAVLEPYGIGSCRRQLLDRTLIWNQRHLMTVLREDFCNTHRPHRTLNQAAPLRPLPDGVTDLDHFRVRRCDRAGGVIHEYRLVAQVFGTHKTGDPFGMPIFAGRRVFSFGVRPGAMPPCTLLSGRPWRSSCRRSACRAW